MRGQEEDIMWGQSAAQLFNQRRVVLHSSSLNAIFLHTTTTTTTYKLISKEKLSFRFHRFSKAIGGSKRFVTKYRSHS